MSKLFTLARQYNFGIEEITEEKTGEKPEDTATAEAGKEGDAVAEATTKTDDENKASEAGDGKDTPADDKPAEEAAVAAEPTAEEKTAEAGDEIKPVEATASEPANDSPTDAPKEAATSSTIEGDGVPGGTDATGAIAAPTEGEPVANADNSAPAVSTGVGATGSGGETEPGATASGEGEGSPTTGVATTTSEEGVTGDKGGILNAGGDDVVENVIAQASNAESVAAEEVSTAAAALDKTVDQTEQLEKVEAALECYAELTAASAKARGLDKAHLHAVSIGLESLLGDFGVDVLSLVPSLESYGLEEERKETTQKFSDRIRQLLASLIKAVAAAYRAVVGKSKEFYGRVKHWSPIIKKRLADAKRAVETFKGEIAPDVTIPSTLRRKLYIGAEGKVTLLNKNNDAVATLSMLGELGDNLKGVGGIVRDFLSALPSEKDVANIKTKVTSVANGLMESLKSGNKTLPAGFELPAGYEVISAGSETYGGKFVLVAATKDEDGNLDAGKMILGLRDVRSSDNITEGTKVTGITKQSLLETIAGLDAIVSTTDKITQAREATVSSDNAIIEGAESLAKSLKEISGATEADAAELTKTLKMFTATARASARIGATNIDATLNHFLSSVIPSYLQLVSLSLKKSSGAEEKPEVKDE